jgi:rsbT co-antagonist protein RsbR
MTSVSSVANYLNENVESLAVEIVSTVLNRMKLEIPEWEKEQAVVMYIEFIGFLARSLTGNKETVPEDLISWSKRNGEHEASSGGRISEIIVRYSPTRAVLTELMTKAALEYSLSVEEASFMIKQINSMLDMSINETVFAFERLSDKILNDTQREMAELSAPVVPLQEGVAVLPLIGNIDAYRANYILEKAVPKIAELDIKYLIVDFSGILNIDLEIAQYLYNIESVLRLIGVQTVVTGLRPKLAQTIVQGGIDMSSLKTFAQVKQALESIK